MPHWEANLELCDAICDIKTCVTNFQAVVVWEENHAMGHAHQNADFFFFAALWAWSSLLFMRIEKKLERGGGVHRHTHRHTRRQRGIDGLCSIIWNFFGVDRDLERFFYPMCCYFFRNWGIPDLTTGAMSVSTGIGGSSMRDMESSKTMKHSERYRHLHLTWLSHPMQTHSSCHARLKKKEERKTLKSSLKIACVLDATNWFCSTYSLVCSSGEMPGQHRAALNPHIQFRWLQNILCELCVFTCFAECKRSHQLGVEVPEFVKKFTESGGGSHTLDPKYDLHNCPLCSLFVQKSLWNNEHFLFLLSWNSLGVTGVWFLILFLPSNGVIFGLLQGWCRPITLLKCDLAVLWSCDTGWVGKRDMWILISVWIHRHQRLHPNHFMV